MKTIAAVAHEGTPASILSAADRPINDSGCNSHLSCRPSIYQMMRLVSIAILLVVTLENDARAQEGLTHKVYYPLQVGTWEPHPSVLVPEGGLSRAQVRIVSTTTNELPRNYDEKVVEAIHKSCSLLESNSTPRPLGLVVINVEPPPDGTITDLRQVQNSGSKLTETLCECAIRLSAPFGNWLGWYETD